MVDQIGSDMLRQSVQQPGNISYMASKIIQLNFENCYFNQDMQLPHAAKINSEVCHRADVQAYYYAIALV